MPLLTLPTRRAMLLLQRVMPPLRLRPTPRKPPPMLPLLRALLALPQPALLQLLRAMPPVRLAMPHVKLPAKQWTRAVPPCRPLVRK